MGKNFVPILAFFLIALVTFFALQIINILTDDPLPEATKKQIETLNPNLNEQVLNELKTSPQN